jgi:hypothetical protein
MTKYLSTLIIALTYLLLNGCGINEQVSYSVPKEPWPESFGNHRVVLKISKPSDVAVVNLEWRRNDKNQETRRFIIVEASTGDTVKNIYRYHVDNEYCKLAFGPVKTSGIYHFYYLPYKVQEGWGFYGGDYLAPEPGPDQEWLTANRVSGNDIQSRFAEASVMEYQSRTSFDSFYPMEIIPLSSEKEAFLARYLQEYLVFPEERTFPIRMQNEIPQKWMVSGPSDLFTGEALKNEYFAFQLGVYASTKELKNIRLDFTSLNSGRNTIPASALTCFNTGGIDPYGNPFVRQVDVAKGNVQPLWIGVDVPETIPPGTYNGEITIHPENAPSATIQVSLKVSNKVIPDRGDSEPWRHSRLRWLNSTLGIDDEPAHPYKPIEYAGESRYNMTGKLLTLHQSGLPGGIRAGNTEILSGPVAFKVETASGIEEFSSPNSVVTLKDKPGVKSASWKSRSENLELYGIGIIESDGYINYKISIKAPTDLRIRDVRLEIPIHDEVAKYMMGMGLQGTTVPKKHEAPWKGPHDSFWIGNTHGGLWCELRGGDYHGPLLNLYQPAHPESWYNNNQGGFSIERSGNSVKAVVYSGQRLLKAGEEITFEWSMLITPVKEINTKNQFTDRYFHNGLNPMPTSGDLESGVKIVNLHHANNYNPYINYPFIAVDSMKWFVDQLHKKGQKVKIYYTIRELTNYTTELWALRSLGNEILGDGRGGGYPWLREHLIEGYHPQWYQHFADKSADASIVNAPGDSRWLNYYIEGLAWLVKHVDIDGLYLDDVSYDRRTVKRIRKVLDNVKPGCLLDLHSNTGFSKGPAMQYAEFFPYMDKLWFGESFMYDQMPPENWLVEVSGIPFGLMGDMLHGGGNRWLGMVYGMTVRHPWTTEGVTCDPRPVWKIWDDFGIESAAMTGYWEDVCPVRTNHPDVYATIYIKEGKSLIALGNWSDKPVDVRLVFDWQKLTSDQGKAMLFAPEIVDFQSEKLFKINDNIFLEPKKGVLLYLQEKDGNSGQ